MDFSLVLWERITLFFEQVTWKIIFYVYYKIITVASFSTNWDRKREISERERKNVLSGERLSKWIKNLAFFFLSIETEIYNL